MPAEAAALLGWYDASHRALPWRAEAGETVDPYFVWLSEIMLQQTTVQAVKSYFAAFVSRWPTVAALAAAPTEDVMAAWAGLGYYARARNLHACARQVAAQHGGHFPADEAGLRALPGIGPYTAAAIAAIAFGKRAVVVDGNVERVIARYFAMTATLPGARPAIYAATDALTPDERAGDFAQAMMDLGATICTPRRPLCAFCPLSPGCRAHAAGIAETLPAKAPKASRRVRRGAAFVVRDHLGRLLVRTRPTKGLLGGMTEVPGTEWIADAPAPAQPEGAPLPANWRNAGSIAHVFTHFELDLTVFAADLDAAIEPPPSMRWLASAEIATAALPTVFRKALARAES